MSVCCECFVLSGRCDLETSRMRRPWLALGCIPHHIISYRIIYTIPHHISYTIPHHIISYIISYYVTSYHFKGHFSASSFKMMTEVENNCISDLLKELVLNS